MFYESVASILSIIPINAFNIRINKATTQYTFSVQIKMQLYNLTEHFIHYNELKFEEKVINRVLVARSEIRITLIKLL